MIASVRGPVIDLGVDRAVIEVGGLGIAVQCTPQTVSVLRRGDEATVHTSLVVREDSLTLYGFADADERSVFEVVQTVSGVGPRLAQAMLASLRPDTLRQIVASEDIAALTQVPGVGKKGAQRLVLELKDKLGAPSSGVGSSPAAAPTEGPAVAGSWQGQVHAALVGLGWSARDADSAVSAVAQELGDEAATTEVAVLLRSALQSLGRAVTGR
ncbi:MAG TPA: Holliday junction branch migration protein RuvA [Actinomycetes bacterium]|nr:Holliday junction branch migration protein RuvA [Actinomycetes bacterium]